MGVTLTKHELEAAHCWEADVSQSALEAARARTSVIERHQSFDHQRLWADLLSSVATSFNLVGDLAADLLLADRAVHAWWPEVPGTVGDVRFAHSPGRLDPTWLGNLVAFDVAFALDLGDDTQGILGIVTAYHDVNRRQPPKPSRLPRYREITDTSGVFVPGALDAVNGTDLIHIWLDHLLVLSMLRMRTARGAGADSSSSTPPATPTLPMRAAAIGRSSSTSRHSPP